MPPLPRLEPCRILEQNGVINLLWLEDAIANYGVPTCTFEVFLIVADPHEAAKILTHAGWTQVDTEEIRSWRILRQEPDITHCCLRPPNWLENHRKLQQAPPPAADPLPPSTTVLLSADDCNLSLASLTLPALQKANFIPPLPYLLDGLITNVLDTRPETDRERRLAMQLVYLYAYCKDILSPAFADGLRYENRQFHVDSLTGLSVGNTRIIAWSRLVRKELLEGTRQLMTCNSLSRALPSELQQITGLARMAPCE